MIIHKDNPIFLAYAAGFFDGEGCVLVSRHKNKFSLGGFNHHLSMTIAQQDRRPLELLCQAFGGTYERSGWRYDENGNVLDKGRDRGVLRWKLVGRKAMEFLAAIEPYSVVKKDQINVALQFPYFDGPPKSGVPLHVLEERERIRLALRELRAEIGRGLYVPLSGLYANTGRRPKKTA